MTILFNYFYHFTLYVILHHNPSWQFDWCSCVSVYEVYLGLKDWHGCLLSLWLRVHIHGVRSLIPCTSENQNTQNRTQHWSSDEKKKKIQLNSTITFQHFTTENNNLNQLNNCSLLSRTKLLSAGCCQSVLFQQNWNPRHACGFDTLCLGPSQVAAWQSYSRQRY